MWEEFCWIFEEILSRCEKANLRIKAKKVILNIAEADILGMRWVGGKISPSPHITDPLTVCDRPKSVKGLRSFLGSVTFNRICLPGPRMAEICQCLEEEIPSNRSGLDILTWTPQMIASFQEIQDLLKQPGQITIPKKGDTLYLASDA